MQTNALLYPPRDNPYGFHGMEGGFHRMADGFHGLADGFHGMIMLHLWWVDSMELSVV